MDLTLNWPSERAARGPVLPARRRGVVLTTVAMAHLGLGWAYMQLRPLVHPMSGELAPLVVSVVSAGRQQRADAPAMLTPTVSSARRPEAPWMPPPEVMIAPAATVSEAPLAAAASTRADSPALDTGEAASDVQFGRQGRGFQTVDRSAVSYLEPPAPVYPMTSRRRGEQGESWIRVQIGTDGVPIDVRLERSSGHARLDEAALTAVRRARFRPYTEQGIPRAVWVSIPIQFELERR